MGGKWSRKACCLSCRKEGTNLQGADPHKPPAPGAQAAGQGWVPPSQEPSALLWRPPADPSLCKSLLSPTHWSLQMQMTGLIRSPPSARRRRPPLVGTAEPPDSASCGPLRSRMLRRTLMAA